MESLDFKERRYFQLKRLWCDQKKECQSLSPSFEREIIEIKTHLDLTDKVPENCWKFDFLKKKEERSQSFFDYFIEPEFTYFQLEESLRTKFVKLIDFLPKPTTKWINEKFGMYLKDKYRPSLKVIEKAKDIFGFSDFVLVTLRIIYKMFEEGNVSKLELNELTRSFDPDSYLVLFIRDLWGKYRKILCLKWLIDNLDKFVEIEEEKKQLLADISINSQSSKTRIAAKLNCCLLLSQERLEEKHPIAIEALEIIQWLSCSEVEVIEILGKYVQSFDEDEGVSSYIQSGIFAYGQLSSNLPSLILDLKVDMKSQLFEIGPYPHLLEDHNLEEELQLKATENLKNPFGKISRSKRLTVRSYCFLKKILFKNEPAEEIDSEDSENELKARTIPRKIYIAKKPRFFKRYLDK